MKLHAFLNVKLYPNRLNSYCTYLTHTAIIMHMSTPNAIRLTITPDVARSLKKAKLRYPALSDPEIFKVGLSLLAASSNNAEDSPKGIREAAAYSLNIDGYLDNPVEEIYHLGMGKPNNFS
jgi:hypothetical protein